MTRFIHFKTKFFRSMLNIRTGYQQYYARINSRLSMQNRLFCFCWIQTTYRLCIIYYLQNNVTDNVADDDHTKINILFIIYDLITLKFADLTVKWDVIGFNFPYYLEMLMVLKGIFDDSTIFWCNGTFHSKWFIILSLSVVLGSVYIKLIQHEHWTLEWLIYNYST